LHPLHKAELTNQDTLWLAIEIMRSRSQVSDADFPFALAIGRSAFQRYDVFLPQSKLCLLFNGHNSFLSRGDQGQNTQQWVLPLPTLPVAMMLSRALTQAIKNLDHNGDRAATLSLDRLQHSAIILLVVITANRW